MRHDWMIASAGDMIAALWTGNPMKVALMTPSYVPNPDTHKLWGDVAAQEVAAGSGYTTGGQDILNRTASYDAAADRTNLLGDDNVWNAATFQTGYAMVYNNSGSKPLWSLVDFEGIKDVVNGVFTIDWAAVGILYVTKV